MLLTIIVLVGAAVYGTWLYQQASQLDKTKRIATSTLLGLLWPVVAAHYVVVALRAVRGEVDVESTNPGGTD